MFTGLKGHILVKVTVVIERLGVTSHEDVLKENKIVSKQVKQLS